MAKCRQLAELELSLGIRSSFNFIPAGTYSVPAELRSWLVENGFEIGVHDLQHDGKLFASRRGFQAKAVQINRYLKEWNAVGFRAGFMLGNLDWLRDLDILYDSSTFDTDPFEFQPEGANTIFPFWVPSIGQSIHPFEFQSGSAAGHRPQKHSNKGYVELPYTLPQDSTLFLVLQETTPDIWKQKLDWLAGNGGMALVNVHPDYIAFSDSSSPREYPVAMYTELLRHLATHYRGQYWNPLPRQLAEWYKSHWQNAATSRFGSDPAAEESIDTVAAGTSPATDLAREPADQTPIVNPLPQAPLPAFRANRPKPKIWIDLDNTPHVPFFEPIMAELTARGFPLLVTARDAFQVCALADKKGMRYTKVGSHHGKNRLLKGAGLLYRAMQLAPLVAREKPVLAVSHGSRSQILLSNFRRSPTLLIEDYEHSQFPPMMHPTWVMAPEMIPVESLAIKNENVRQYPGIKEDVYAWSLVPEADFLQKLGVNPDDLVVTVRPPATEAHYHNPESEKLFERFMQRAHSTPRTRIILLPRNQKQGELIRHTWPAWFENDKTLIPAKALDGLNLIWHSDFVVSGGGTMNREAAALGVPVYSIFRGSIGAVDRQLSAEGRLILIESVEDVDRKIQFTKQPRRSVSEITSKRTLLSVVDSIEKIAESYAR